MELNEYETEHIRNNGTKQYLLRAFLLHFDNGQLQVKH